MRTVDLTASKQQWLRRHACYCSQARYAAEHVLYKRSARAASYSERESRHGPLKGMVTAISRKWHASVIQSRHILLKSCARLKGHELLKHWCRCVAAGYISPVLWCVCVRE